MTSRLLETDPRSNIVDRHRDGDSHEEGSRPVKQSLCTRICHLRDCASQFQHEKHPQQCNTDGADFDNRRRLCFLVTACLTYSTHAPRTHARARAPHIPDESAPAGERQSGDAGISSRPLSLSRDRIHLYRLAGMTLPSGMNAIDVRSFPHIDMLATCYCAVLAAAEGGGFSAR